MTPTPSQELYQAAKNSLGKHMTLNDNIPAEVGCAEAVSAIFKLVDVSDGPEGIAGTTALGQWMASNPRFERITELEEGAIVVFETGTGNGSIEGHVFICAAFNLAFPNDWGLMSNDSASGLFLERWNWTRANAYYHLTGGLPINIFRLVDNSTQA